MDISLKQKNAPGFYEVYNRDNKIGTVKILFTDEKNWLNWISLESDCRGKKYGPAIIGKLMKEFKSFRISLSDKRSHYITSQISDDTRCLNELGFDLVKKCYYMGILKKYHFEFPFAEELWQYRSDRFLDNTYYSGLNQINSIVRKINEL